MPQEILDEIINPKKHKYSYGQESYWLLLISIFLWLITSMSIGITGHLFWTSERMIAAFISFIIFVCSMLGFSKGLKSRKLNEPKTKEQRFGIAGNMLFFIAFLVISFDHFLAFLVLIKSSK